jgi:hypothetical protein
MQRRHTAGFGEAWRPSWPRLLLLLPLLLLLRMLPLLQQLLLLALLLQQLLLPLLLAQLPPRLALLALLLLLPRMLPFLEPLGPANADCGYCYYELTACHVLCILLLFLLYCSSSIRRPLL